MPAPEKKFTQDFFDVNPPVIPVKFTRPKGRGRPGVLSKKGFQGYKLVDLGDGKWSVTITPKFTVKIMSDGYAEIPDTEYNKKLLSILSKDRMSKPTYDRGIGVDAEDSEKFWFRDKNDNIKILTQEAIDNGEIRIVSKGFIQKAEVTKLNSLREFNIKDTRSVDATLVQLVRPWKSEFVKVDAAVMEAAPI